MRALVLDDRNSDFGVIGRNWARKVRGPNGESLWFHFDGSFHFRVSESNRVPQKQVALPEIQEGETRRGLKRAFMVAKREGRSATDMFRHLNGMLRHLNGNQDHPLAGSFTNMETVVSAKPRYVLGSAMDADEILLNLPEGSRTRVEFAAKKIEITAQKDHREIVLTHGMIRWVDPVGIARVLVSADGGAEQLVIEARYDSDEIVMKIRTQRLADGFPAPVQVRMNVETGELDEKGEGSDPPHGSVRYEIQENKKEAQMRMKMKWRYEMKELAAEAEAESGKSWEEILGDR